MPAIQVRHQHNPYPQSEQRTTKEVNSIFKVNPGIAKEVVRDPRFAGTYIAFEGVQLLYDFFGPSLTPLPGVLAGHLKKLEEDFCTTERVYGYADLGAEMQGTVEINPQETGDGLDGTTKEASEEANEEMFA
jgi:hypothetical protein